jgi:tetratricopeptide (TPR) repeat protein
MTLHEAGRLEEAAQGFERLLLQDPLHAEGLFMLSGIRLQTGREEEAILGLRQVTALRPGSAPVHAVLGAALMETGRLAEALESLDQAVTLSPSDSGAAYNRALCLMALGREPEAVEALGRAIELDPSLPAEVRHWRGEALNRLGRYAEALADFDAALALRPDFEDARHGRGVCLLGLERLEEALVVFDAVLRTRPDDVEAWLNRGVTLQLTRRLEEAVQSFERAGELRPDFGEAHHNRGLALGELNRCEEAITAFDLALQSPSSDPAQSRYSRSLQLLKLGRLEEGFQEYRYRWERAGAPRPMTVLPAPPWEGESLTGKTIVVYGEQGFGDILQFIRYVKPLSRMAGRVIAVVYPPLVDLVRSIPDVEVTASFEGLACDYQIPVMCLPRLLGATPATLAAEVPYLTADPAKAADWAARLSDLEAGLKVGLVWAGNSRQHDRDAHAIDQRRSLSLQQLRPLGEIPDIQFVSLQKGSPADQARPPPPGLPLTDFTDELKDFSDTAALVAGLDLVITVDTAVAHLVGALGKPVWILSRFDGCWRWLNGREDSPWYPTARLFHQKTDGDWDEVIRRVAGELARQA